MLVDVLMLRHGGAKLDRTRLKEIPPIRAELLVHNVYGTMYAELRFPWNGPISPGTKVPRLRACRLRTIRGSSIVLHGTETVGMRHAETDVPQAWWCQVLPESERPPNAPTYQPLPRPRITAD
jgi:hypothetical protein